MKTITQKLNSRRGASLLIALLFFFLAAMVGSVILASATANVDRLAEREQRRQDYLALSSAIRFLRGTFEDLKGETWEQRWTYGCKGVSNIVPPDAAHEDKNEIAQEMTLEGTPAGDGKLQALAAGMAYDLFCSKTEYYPKSHAPAAVEFTIEAENMPIVDVVMRIDTDYSLVLTLKVRDAAEQATLTIKAATTLDKSEGANPCSHTCRYYADSNGDGVEESYDSNTTFSSPKYTNTLKLTWGRASVNREVLNGG